MIHAVKAEQSLCLPRAGRDVMPYSNNVRGNSMVRHMPGPGYDIGQGTHEVHNVPQQ
jgi:hypothetical protein